MHHVGNVGEGIGDGDDLGVERGASQVMRSYGAGSYGHTVLDPTVIHVPPVLDP